MGKLRDAHGKSFKTLGNIVRRGLPFERRIHGQHDFVDAAFLDPAQELVDGQVFRPHPVERRQPAAKHMITAVEQPGTIQRPEVRHFLHHAERTRIAARIGADAARVGGIDVAAGPALDQRLAHGGKRID